MKRMGRVLGMAALLALGASGARADNPYLSLRTPEGVIVARVSEARIVGPDIRVTRDVKTLRGRAFGQTVFLGLNGNEVGGTVGRNLSRLSFEHNGEVLEAEGAFYGNFARLSLSARESLRHGGRMQLRADGHRAGGLPGLAHLRRPAGAARARGARAPAYARGPGPRDDPGRPHASAGQLRREAR